MFSWWRIEESEEARGFSIVFRMGHLEQTPNLSNGGLHLPYAEDGLYQREPPRTMSACEAVAFGDAMDGFLSGPKEIGTKMRVKIGPCVGPAIEKGFGVLGLGQHAFADLYGRGFVPVRGMSFIR